MTGTPERYQQLILRRGEGDLVTLSDKMCLRDYGAKNGMELEVYDKN